MTKTRMFGAGFVTTLAVSFLLSSAPGDPVKTDGEVSTGLVSWHKDHAAALAAAQKSGKPVLHFQLLGRLDEEFC